jgi:hypothetical protein
MLTKRCAALEAIHWPANTTSWARADGLSPPKLRDLRHFGANLETADSFILEPGAEMPLFVSFRAAHFVVDGEARWQPPRSPTIESAPGSPPLPRAREGTLASRSSSNSSAATSPSGATGANALQQQQLTAPQTPVVDMSAFSPRSAPELSSTFEAGSGTGPVHRGFEVRGMVTLRAWTMPAAAQDAAPGAEDPSLAADKSAAPSAAKSWASTSSSSRPGSLYGSHVSSAQASSTTDTSVSTEQEGAGQVTTLPFWAYSCRPQLAVSSSRATPTHRHLEEDSLAPTQPHVHGLITLDFGDIFVGQSDEREITLLNQSEIDIFWQARLDDADSMLAAPPLSLVDNDTGAVVRTVSSSDEVQSRPHIVAACTAQTLRVALLPREPCRDFEQVISFSNLHNASNTVRVLVRANMLGAATDDALAVLSGDSIDFGDCCGGHWTRQLLVLKNNGDHILDVAFSVQRGVEANFQLAELAPQIEEISSDDLFMEPPPPAASGALPTRQMDSEPSNASSSRSDATSSAVSQEGWRLLSPRSGHDTDDEDAANSAAELAKTPTHHALTTSAPDPPPLQLAEATPQPGERGLIKACTPLGLPTKRQSDDDVDASSVASQAGSTPGSPVQARTKLSAESSAGGSAVESGDNADGEERTSRLRPQPSSDMLFAPHPAARHQREGTSTNEDVVSLRSEITTATSQDSRIGSYAATSSQHSGPSRTSARIGGSSGVVLRGLRSVEQAHSNQLEELVLRPGAEYRVVVAYRPQRGQVDEHFSAGRLREDTFNISLDYARARADGARSRGGRQRKTVLCRLRTCTSFITVSPQLIDFGEANVGARKSAHVAVENRSELTARIDVRFVSKVLSMYRDEVAIPALQTVELRVDFFPRRINEAYRKQITVANLMNRTDDQIFEVRAKNVDRQRVSFHSLFYRILTASGANFIDFGDVNINSTRVRTFSIENISGGRLALELSAAHPEDLRLFVKAPPAKEAAPGSEAAGTDATDRPRTPNKATEADAADATGAPKVATLEVPGKSKTGASGADLKERFLETISVDSPASIRRENASWRLAQKHSHVRAAKEASSKATAGTAAKDSGAAPKPKAPINMVSALKKGGKGRISLQWGRSMTFKDRKILSDFEYLDLATGPPVDTRRISVKSKKYQTLETLEMGERSTRSTPASSKLNVRASRAEQSTTDTASGDVGSGSISRASTTKKSRPSVSSRKITSTATSDAKEPPATPAASSKAAAAAAEAGEAESGSNKSPALTGKRKPQASSLSNPASVSKLTLDELIAAVEAQSSTLSAFFMGSAEAEERAVRTEINLQRELQAAISSGRLVPVDLLELDTNQERQIVAVYTPVASTRPHIQGNSRKQDSRIFLRLAQFDDAVVRASAEFSAMADLEIDELPVRDLMVRSTLCRSLLELGQPHINFGHMEKGDSKARKILIQNRSEWALRYCIRKSGSIASGDIKIAAGLYGIVPGHGKREVDFLFSPSLTGQFQEKLVVENVADRERDQTVSLKATVRKVPNFAVEPASIDFGVCQPGKLTRAEGFVVTNTTAKARTFVVAVDSDELRHQRSIVDVVIAAAAAAEGSVRGTLSKAEEEEVEHISQKLKIATRKGHTDKVKKYETRLTELGIKTPSSTVSAPFMRVQRAFPDASATGRARSWRQRGLRRARARCAGRRARARCCCCRAVA